MSVNRRCLPCEFPGCPNKQTGARGLCTTHLGRLRRTGDPATTGRPKESIERLWSKFQRDPATGCWVWTASRNARGYGYVTGTTAYKKLYTILVGPVPDGLVLDHLCRNTSCVNPAHLEPVTQRENLHRSPLFGANKTHCKHGHEFTPENTYVDRDGRRSCRACHRVGERERQRRLRAAEQGRMSA